MKGYKEYLKVIKDCGWNVNVTNKDIEIENWSPAGENLVEYLNKDADIFVQVSEIALSFDIDEHVEPLIEMRGTYGVPSSISTLIEDAEKIQCMYSELANKLLKKKKEIEARREK